jgi:3-ketosteroid 9alpha-monooxygenase subunit B
MSDNEGQGWFRSLIVEHVVREARDCSSIVLSIPSELGDVFLPKPGQFLAIRAMIESQEYVRCYSVSRLPGPGASLRITVKRIDDGVVSRWLNDMIKPGDRLMVSPAAGRFLLRSSENEAIFFAAGSGITPILPMIRRAVESDNRRTALFYWNRGEDDAIFLHELRDLARRFPDRFEYSELYGRRTDSNQKRSICYFAARHRGADAYLCGPDGFMAFCRNVLRAEGFSEDAIFEERFARGTTVLPEELGPARDAMSVTVTIIRDGERRQVQADSNHVLLDSMLASGLAVPHSCKEGHCGACMVRLVNGEVERLSSSALSRRDRQKGLILACRSKPASADVELSYDF